MNFQAGVGNFKEAISVIARGSCLAKGYFKDEGLDKEIVVMGAEHASAAYEAMVKIISPDDFLQRHIDQAKNDTKVTPTSCSPTPPVSASSGKRRKSWRCGRERTS